MKELKEKDRVIFKRTYLVEGVIEEISPSKKFVNVSYSGFGRSSSWIARERIVEILEPKKARWF